MVGSRVRSFMRKGDASSIAVGSGRRIIRPARVAPGDQAGSTVTTRTAARRVELRCAGCGYGIIVSGAIPLCPMCRTSDWEPGVIG